MVLLGYPPLFQALYGDRTMIYRLISFFLTAAIALVATVVLAQSPETARGSQILAPYKKGLKEALQSGLSRGLVEAIQACQIQAPKIAESLSHDGIRVGRTSHRLRNPANTPPYWVEPILAEYVASISDREPRSVSLSRERLCYVEPIIVQPQCLACHGELLNEDISMQINKLYPQDQAVGFKAGELRGVLWTEYPVEKVAK